ncbi:MAG: GAF domain-containing protein [Deltaproteobacteria bacterium]|nr:GAF domain-containing protein [Deltaproteobacteria bacterium]
MIQNEKLNTSLKMNGEKRAWPLISLYLEDGSENHRNVSAHCVLTREIITIHDVYSEDGCDFHGTRELDAIFDYRSKSMLLVPMTDHEDEVIGVLQLLNARRGISLYRRSYPAGGQIDRDDGERDQQDPDRSFCRCPFFRGAEGVNQSGGLDARYRQDHYSGACGGQDDQAGDDL